jgi:hypothetical protein
MQHSAKEYAVHGKVVLASLLWLDLLPSRWLGHAALLFLVWAVASTIFVALVAAWVALARSRRRWHHHPGL